MRTPGQDGGHEAVAGGGRGHRHEARAELATAVAMLREMEMTFWLPEAEAELAETPR
jgi:hypothetical protein